MATGTSRVDTWETIIAIGRHSTVKGLNAYAAAAAIDRLARLAKTLHRLYEVACSVDVPLCRRCAGLIEDNGVPHRPAHCFEARVERAEARAAALGAELGCVVTTQRDPRGCSVSVWADKAEGRLLGMFS